MTENTLSILDDSDDLLQVMNCVGEPSIDDFESFLDVDDFHTDSLSAVLTEERKGATENMCDDAVLSCDLSFAASESTASSTKKRTSNKQASKPRRPLSAYNLFFQLERDRIVSGEADKDFTEDDVKSLTSTSSEDRQKRRFKKTNGKIPFAALAKMIGNKWKDLDEKSRKIFEFRAKEEEIRYSKEMDLWKKQQKNKDDGSAPSTTLVKQETDAPDAISESSRSEEMTITSETGAIDSVPAFVHRNPQTSQGMREDEQANEQTGSSLDNCSESNRIPEQRKVFPPPRRNHSAYKVTPELNRQPAQQMMQQRRLMMQSQQMQRGGQQFNNAMRLMQSMPSNATPQQRQHMMQMMQHRKRQIMQHRRMQMMQRQQMMQRSMSLQGDGSQNGNYPMDFNTPDPNNPSGVACRDDGSASGEANHNAYDMADQAFNMAQSTLMANGAFGDMNPNTMMANGSSRRMKGNPMTANGSSMPPNSMMGNGSSRGMPPNAMMGNGSARGIQPNSMMGNGSSRGMQPNSMMGNGSARVMQPNSRMGNGAPMGMQPTMVRGNGPTRLMKPNPMMMMQRRGSTGHAPQNGVNNFRYAKMMRRMSAPGMMGQQGHAMNAGNFMPQNMQQSMQQNMMMQHRRQMQQSQHQQQMQMARSSNSPTPNSMGRVQMNPAFQNQQGMFSNGQRSSTSEINDGMNSSNMSFVTNPNDEGGLDGEVSLDPHQGLLSPAFDGFDEQNNNTFPNTFE